MKHKDMILLSKEQVEAQISTLDLLMAMYPSNDEIVLDTETCKQLDTLRTWCTLTDDDGEISSNIPTTLSLELTVTVDIDEDSSQSTIQLSIELPLYTDGATDSENTTTLLTPPPPRVRLRQPLWMNKTQTAHVNASIPTDQDTNDILAIIDHLRNEAAQYLSISNPNPTHNLPTISTNSTPLVRVWFYFPSLSTRSKRSDLVDYAPTYNLTGFVLAGKPGLLCLEGESARIDEYMSFIKTESWSDIPSAHKKVSERVRDVIEVRVFQDMREITGEEWMERRGERGNRNDLRVLEAWLDGLGLKGVVGRVVM